MKAIEFNDQIVGIELPIKIEMKVKEAPPGERKDAAQRSTKLVTLENGSQIKASTTSGDAGRSEALSLLVIDEAAHVEGLEELWTGLYPTLSTGGRCIALSTPNGVGNWFHQTYVDAENEVITGKEKKFVLKTGDPIRARVVAVSLNELSSRESKIGLTMRQPALGAHDWIYAPEEKETKKEKKKKGEK